MDRDGIAAELIYASVGMGIFMHRDGEYKAACMKAYNRWLAAMCADAPERVYGMAQTAVLDVDSAIADFQEAKDMGMVGMMMSGDPAHEDYDHPDYDALWECATDLQLPIAFHILTSRAGALTAPTRGHKMNGFLGIIRAIQDVVGLMTLGGVFERHPDLKLVVAESDAGWLPHYMYRMDHAARMNAEGGIIPGLSKLPSDYIKANVYATFQDDETAYHAVEQFPYDHLLWASDFPHTDSTWPKSRALIEEQAGHLTEEQKQAIFRDNTAGLFNLPAGQRSWRMEEAAAVA
jgi:predicted TIM-barrel fold metal-dependent hydrolase